MSRKDIDSDLNQALEDLKAGKPMNGKDGYTSKTVKSSYGSFELDTPQRSFWHLHYWLSVLTDLQNRGPDRLCRGPHRLPRSHWDHLPRDRGPAVHHPPDPQLNEVRGLEEPEGLYGRPESCLSGCHQERGGDRSQRAGRQVRQAVPGGYPFLAQEMGQPICLLQVSGGCP